MPKPSVRPDPDTPPLKVPRRNRSWPEVQLPPFTGTVSYERARAAVLVVKERRTGTKPA
jgi:NADH:ubiquinone oxidoreductase subunit